MTAFPRTILPTEVSELDIPGPLISKAQSGKVNIRSTQQIGRTWSERYLLKVTNTADRAFLATVRNFWRNGTVFDIGHVDYATPKGVGGGTPLVNNAAQLVTNPENFGAWSVSGTPVLTSGQADPYGGTAAYKVDDDTAGAVEAIFQAVTFTADATKTASLFIRAGTASSLLCEFGIVDNSAGFTWRHRVRGSFNADGTLASLTTVAGSGTIFTAISYSGGWYRCLFTVVGVIAANQNLFYFYPTGVTASATGTTFAFGANAWNSTTPANYNGPSISAVTGSLLIVDGAPASTTNWLRSGDIMRIAGLSPVYELTADVSSEAGGYALLSLNPPIFAGGSPADNASLTITGVTMPACIIAPPDFPTTSGKGADYGELLLQFSEVL